VTLQPLSLLGACWVLVESSPSSSPLGDAALRDTILPPPPPGPQKLWIWGLSNLGCWVSLVCHPHLPIGGRWYVVWS
jgi:hypothetical protein